jgi:hypothetical protein
MEIFHSAVKAAYFGDILCSENQISVSDPDPDLDITGSIDTDPEPRRQK